ncbi:response regulator transcription factor [Lachnoclostridium sp. An118]|uniref:response regulator transcription factor n=1 Tax=Lachnoclostridium sp. An118 TaxID=1965547 RepID=UPI000B36DC6D|nr:response regulator transcription factor [Lachnoclostridium sp. An118]OUQ51501.1 DNA-binding response regulator [Lachnoclostridium sp. An118]
MDHILIIDDDANINGLLKEALERAGYSCSQAYSGTEALLRLDMEECDLALLDLMLPGMPGEKVLEEIRRKRDIPVIVLTAKDRLDDKVDLLKSGADDYVTKPFEIREVLARIEVQLRRRGTAEAAGNTLSHREMTLDKETFKVFVRGRELPRFTRQEFAILELLLSHPGRVYSKEEIFEYAWEEPYMGETKTLDVHISNIRRKIKRETQEEYIETIWGIGYRMPR